MSRRMWAVPVQWTDAGIYVHKDTRYVVARTRWGARRKALATLRRHKHRAAGTPTPFVG